MKKGGDNNTKCDEPSGNEPKQQQDKTGTGASRKRKASFTSTQRPLQLFAPTSKTSSTQRPLQVSGDSNHPGSPIQQHPNRQTSQQQQICKNPSMAAQSPSSQKHPRPRHHPSSHQSKMQTDDIRQRSEIIALKSHLEGLPITTITDKQEKLNFTEFKNKFLEYFVSKKQIKPPHKALKLWMKDEKIPFYTEKDILYCNANVLFNFEENKGAKNDFMPGTNYKKKFRDILLRHNIVRELCEELSFGEKYIFEIPFNQIVNINQGTAIPNIGGPGPDAQS